VSARRKESPSEGDCRFANCVTMYADGELAADHAMEVEEHVTHCSGCAERLELLRATRTSLKRRCSSACVPPALHARVCAAMMGARGDAQTRAGHSGGVERDSSSTGSSSIGTSLDGATFDNVIPSNVIPSNVIPSNSISSNAIPSNDLESGSGPLGLNAKARPAGEPRLIKLRYAVAMVAAAGFLFAIGFWRIRQDEPVAARAGLGDGSSTTGDFKTGSARFDRMLDELVSLHANPLPPETTDPEDLQRFDPLVGVPVRRSTLRPFDGHFKGARVHAMRDRRAAILHYTVRGKHRVTVYVFNPQEVPIRDARLKHRIVRKHPVYVGQLRGYSVATTEDRGVGYALATDLDRTESAELVLAAYQP